MDDRSLPSPPRRLLPIIAAVGLLLAIPFIAMQFTDEVQWSGFDFLAGGTLLLGTGLLTDVILRTFKKRKTRLLSLAALWLALLLTWAELAVGVFGTSFTGS